MIIIIIIIILILIIIILIHIIGLIENINLYADAAIQYGFSTLFVTALPIAPCLSFVSNYFKSKLNIWKTIKVRYNDDDDDDDDD